MDNSIGELIAAATAARAATADKSAAFGGIVRRYQDFAFACAFAVLGDFHLAEDAAQEAFITAWRYLDSLREPAAFGGWLRRIVLTQCNRLTRGLKLDTVALGAVGDLAAPGVLPEALAETRERQARVQAAIGELPEHERLATLLFYLGDYSQNEIATLLDVPVGTIKKRLFSARQRLRERMDDDMLRDTLHEQRPSRNETFADTVALFNSALDAFVARVRQDRYIVAAILFGSLSHDTVWRKSDIDIILVGRDEAPARAFSLVENGVNIHAILNSRSQFKKMIEGTLQGTFMHSAFALSTLLFTTDDTIRAYYDNVRQIGSRDRQMRLMTAGQGALGTIAKAEKWLVTRKDVAYSFLWVMYTVQHLATIEVLLHGELTSREVVPQALKLNPSFFNRVYSDLIQRPKDEASVRDAIDLMNAYIDEKHATLFGPIVAYLRDEGAIRTTSEIDLYFANQVQADSLVVVYEWLADKGILRTVPAPVRLTRKSQVTVDEAAYYLDE
ncbi:MAG TPA: sigma-70 family RNA polymerase sigma factor [Roseiflexaceae bacterium]|nr:sigma-70 family RNA polymerase sigma factor [Roseiflexaceae bacterium]